MATKKKAASKAKKVATKTKKVATKKPAKHKPPAKKAGKPAAASVDFPPPWDPGSKKTKK